VKTLEPLILTACIADPDLKPFHALRQQHFPADRNFLSAHLTMFHRLPGEYVEQIAGFLHDIAAKQITFSANVAGVRHLGAGVAFMIESSELQDVHARLRSRFMPWLGGQDLQKWKPHITIQNKVSRQQADALHRRLSENFKPTKIEVTGVDLWRYLGGPWQHERSTMFQAR
jgi:2'-5' RNA ligase